MDEPRKRQALRHSWIYGAGLLIAAVVILLYFFLNPAAESPPRP